MSAMLRNLLGLLLAVAALFAGGAAMGWPGVLLVLTVIVFLLALQFTQVMRLMRRVGSAPLGQTPSCLMLQSRLHAGLPLMKVLELAGSLGEAVEGETGSYRWRDPGGDQLLARFDASSRLLAWQFSRAS